MSKRFIGIAEETTFRTPVSATEWIDIVSESINPNRNVIDVETAGRRELVARVPGPFFVSGSFDMIVNADNITKLLKWLLGNVSTSDDGGSPAVYKHEFTPGDSIKSFTLEICPGVGGQSRQIAGTAVRSIAFEAPARELLTATVEVLGAKEELISSSTPTFSSLRPFIFFEGSLTLEGSSVGRAEAFRCTIANTIPDDTHVLGDMFLPAIDLLGIRVTGDMDVAFTSWDYWKRFYGSATATEPQTSIEPVSLQFKMTGQSTGSSVAGFENYLLQIDIPKAILDATNANFDRRERIVQGLGFGAVYDESSDYIVKVTVVNKKSAP